ncbi:hypothetical protein, partial [uncultured Polaribacter sp.]|uniref:hypothetical protein n=1 Tax=uncultured Polaribacter sp. TaxID=174711 RepID=UPI00261A40D7
LSKNFPDQSTEYIALAYRHAIYLVISTRFYLAVKFSYFIWNIRSVIRMFVNGMNVPLLLTILK